MSSSVERNNEIMETKEISECINPKNEDVIEPLTNGIEKLENRSVIDEQVNCVTDVETEKDKNEWVDLLGSGAILKKIIYEGKPETRPQRCEKCIINYSCLLGNVVVDSAENFKLHLGESDVISGLDVALGLMNIGEKCMLKIQPRLAFGKKGLPPKIPPEAELLYNVELVSVEPEDEIESLSIQQRKLIGNKKRERGNWWYSRGDNNIAIQCYRRALDYLDEVEGGITSGSDSEKTEVTDSDLQNLLEDRISVYNNMAAAQIKMEMFDAALSSLQIVLRCKPNNVKAHFRKAKVYMGKNDLPTAMKCLMKAKELAPNDNEIQKEIVTVAKILEKQKISEKELARRMFNVPKKTESKLNSKKDFGKNKLGLWATLGATVAVGVAGIMAYRFKYT